MLLALEKLRARPPVSVKGGFVVSSASFARATGSTAGVEEFPMPRERDCVRPGEGRTIPFVGATLLPCSCW